MTSLSTYWKSLWSPAYERLTDQEEPTRRASPRPVQQTVDEASGATASSSQFQGFMSEPSLRARHGFSQAPPALEAAFLPAQMPFDEAAAMQEAAVAVQLSLLREACAAAHWQRLIDRCLGSGVNFTKIVAQRSGPSNRYFLKNVLMARDWPSVYLFVTHLPPKLYDGDTVSIVDNKIHIIDKSNHGAGSFLRYYKSQKAESDIEMGVQRPSPVELAELADLDNLAVSSPRGVRQALTVPHTTEPPDQVKKRVSPYIFAPVDSQLAGAHEAERVRLEKLNSLHKITDTPVDAK